MKERTLEFDSIIAICALLISSLAVATSVYQTWVFRDQTRVIHDQYAATIWPYININDTTDTTGSGPEAKVSLIAISLTNNGLGPALIRDAQLFLDNRAVSKWNTVRDVLQRAEDRIGGKITHTQMASIDAATTIRPGDSRQLFEATLAPAVPMQQLLQHNLRIDLCYCSINGQCWTLQYNVARGSRSFPTPAAHCQTIHGIESSSV
jgi:hypothetical protein